MSPGEVGKVGLRRGEAPCVTDPASPVMYDYEWELTSTGCKLHLVRWEHKSMCGQSLSPRRTLDYDIHNELDSFRKCAICERKSP